MPEKHTNTEEQTEILRLVQTTSDNLLIDARAGTGKTSTLISALEVIPAVSTLVCAFNKRIATEMEERLPPLPPGRAVVVKTLHSLGLATLRYHFPHLQVDDDCTDVLVTEAAQEILRATGGGSFSMKMRRSAVRLLTVLKDTQIEPKLTNKLIQTVGIDFDVFGALESADITFVVQVVWLAYQNSLDFKRRTAVAFADMVWGPVALKLAPRGRFKAVFVDEAQDVSAPQFELLQKMVAPGGRLIVVGDPMQGIYAWRGAVGTLVWQRMYDSYKAVPLPLTITWRCPKAVVKLANELVPDLKARPGAPEGEVRDMVFDKLAAELKRNKSTTFVLSRTNADLLRVAMELWRAGVRFSLNGGREIIEPLFWIIEKLDLTSKAAFCDSAKRWHDAEQKKAETAESSTWADRASQQYGMLMVAIEYAVQPLRVAGLLRDVLGSERKTEITLSTVHKVKGLEADRVYLLKETFHRHRKGKPCLACQRSDSDSIDCYRCGGSGEWKPPTPAEELNIEYVAITRAKASLVWVTFPDNPLTKILRQRMMEDLDKVVGDAALQAVDHQSQDDEYLAEAVEHHYGAGSTIMLDGRISQPGEDGSHRIIDPHRVLKK